MKPSHKGFLSGIALSATLLLIWLWYLNMQPTHISISDGEDGISCLGWARTGVMSNTENELFRKLTQYCINNNKDSYNSALRIHPKDIEASCSSNNIVIYEPYVPTITLQVKNASKRSLFILEQQLTLDTENTGGKFNNNYLYRLSLVDKSRTVKEIKPGETLHYSVTPELQSYGEFTFNLIYGNWQIINKTPSYISQKMVWEDDVTCMLKWSSNA